MKKYWRWFQGKRNNNVEWIATEWLIYGILLCVMGCVLATYLTMLLERIME